MCNAETCHKNMNWLGDLDKNDDQAIDYNECTKLDGEFE